MLVGQGPAGWHGGAAGCRGQGRLSTQLPGRLGEQLVHFHVMQLMDLLFLWVGATPHLHNLAVAMCNRYDSIPVSMSLLEDTSDTVSTGLA